jgi:glucose-1-phosphate adenylyltransferase
MTRLSALILGGGQGSRLQPLTQIRSKPAVPIAGKFRLIDIPISNCLHSGINHIFILTQFNSESLHRHIHLTYRFDNFSGGYIRILAAQQTAETMDWYQGTADAVRKNLFFFRNLGDHIIILSGDHLYRMDYRKFFDYHLRTDSDISIAVKPIKENAAREFGILKANKEGRITAFYEKPSEQKILDDYRVDPALFNNFDIDPGDRTHIASMGIYIFNKKVLFDVLENNTMEDFGREIIPDAIKSLNCNAYFFDDYWRDIGNMRSFLNAHMDLTKQVPDFNFYDEQYPFFSRPRFLPASKFNNCQIHDSIIADGSIVLQAKIINSVIGIRSYIDHGTQIQGSIVMGNTRYETIEEHNANRDTGQPNLGIGNNCNIRDAILDLDARVGNNVQLINQERVMESFQDNYAIRDGIIIIPKGAVIPHDTVI